MRREELPAQTPNPNPNPNPKSKIHSSVHKTISSFAAFINHQHQPCQVAEKEAKV
jgi:hypothetical protein